MPNKLENIPNGFSPVNSIFRRTEIGKLFIRGKVRKRNRPAFECGECLGRYQRIKIIARRTSRYPVTVQLSIVLAICALFRIFCICDGEFGAHAKRGSDNQIFIPQSYSVTVVGALNVEDLGWFGNFNSRMLRWNYPKMDCKFVNSFWHRMCHREVKSGSNIKRRCRIKQLTGFSTLVSLPLRSMIPRLSPERFITGFDARGKVLNGQPAEWLFEYILEHRGLIW